MVMKEGAPTGCATSNPGEEHREAVRWLMSGMELWLRQQSRAGQISRILLIMPSFKSIPSSIIYIILDLIRFT